MTAAAVAAPGLRSPRSVRAVMSRRKDGSATVNSATPRWPSGARAGQPEDVEGIMVFLASDESRYATGSLFRVDGGLTAL